MPRAYPRNGSLSCPYERFRVELTEGEKDATEVLRRSTYFAGSVVDTEVLSLEVDGCTQLRILRSLGNKNRFEFVVF